MKYIVVDLDVLDVESLPTAVVVEAADKFEALTLFYRKNYANQGDPPADSWRRKGVTVAKMPEAATTAPEVVEVTHACGHVLGTFVELDDHGSVMMVCPKCHQQVEVHNQLIMTATRVEPRSRPAGVDYRAFRLGEV